MPARIEADVNPELLRWARETVGVPLSQVARRFKKIERWERGEERPSVSQLESLSELYKRPLAVFYLPTPPHELPLPTDFRVFTLDEPEPLSKASRLAIRAARRVQRLYAELSEGLHIESARRALHASPSDDPETLAGRVRRQLGVSIEEQSGFSDVYTAFRTWRTAIEEMGILVLQFTMPLKELRGFSLSDGPVPTVAANSSDAVVARSFTLFHELAHLMLNKGGLCIPDPSATDSARDIEPFCNHFAGAVLVPIDVVDEDSDLRPINVNTGDEEVEERAESVGFRLRVSRYVVLRRLLIAGRVSIRQFRRLMDKWQRADAARRQRTGGGPSPAVKAVTQLGTPFVGLVLEAHARGLVSTSDASNYLLLKVRHLSEVQRLIAVSARG